MDQIEYRVRPVTRYVVTRWHGKNVGVERNQACSSVLGEYDNQNIAYEVSYALAKAEHDRLGWPLGDERMKYPEPQGQIRASDLHKLMDHAIANGWEPQAAEP